MLIISTMDEAWEKAYSKFFWILVMLAALGWITAQFLDSYHRGGLKSDTIHFFQHYAPVFVACSLVVLLFKRWTSFQNWGLKSRRNMFAYQLVFWSAVYAPMALLSWKWTLSDGSLMVVCMATAFTFSAELSSPKSNGA